MTKNPLIFIFFLYAISVSFAQNDILNELNDSETQEPIAFATIHFKGTSRGLVADYYGQFRLPCKPVDSLPVILITSRSYKPLKLI